MCFKKINVLNLDAPRVSRCSVFWSCVPAITVSLSQDRHNTAALHWMRLRSAPPASRSQSLMVLSNEPDASRGPLDARHHTQPRWVLMVPRPARVCISLPLGPSRRSHRFTFLSLEPEAHIASSPPSRRTQFTSAMWPEGRMMCSKGEEVLDDSIRWGLSEAFWDWTCRLSSPAPLHRLNRPPAASPPSSSLFHPTSCLFLSLCLILMPCPAANQLPPFPSMPRTNQNPPLARLGTMLRAPRVFEREAACQAILAKLSQRLTYLNTEEQQEFKRCILEEINTSVAALNWDQKWE